MLDKSTLQTPQPHEKRKNLAEEKSEKIMYIKTLGCIFFFFYISHLELEIHFLMLQNEAL